MIVRRFSLLAWLALALAVPAFADAAADVWIAKARAFLGSEEALSRVTSLHLEGSFSGVESVPDPADETKRVERPVEVGIEIIFQQPMQQRQTLRSDKVERVTALDDYDGWERVTDLTGKNPPRLALLDATNIKRLRATTVENLGFYSNYRGAMRQVQYLGDETVDGVECVKLSFAHSERIVFVRFFEKTTGRLVKTEIEGGGEIREEGEIVVEGIRFPKTIVNKSVNGRVTAITFHKVSVNVPFPPETFAVPAIPSR